MVIPMHIAEILPSPNALGDEIVRQIVDKNIPRAILWQAVDRAIATRDFFPHAAWMLKTCNELLRQPSDWLRAIANKKAEHERRDREAQARRDLAAQNDKWLRDLRRRLAVAGDAPSLADIELARKMQPGLHRGGIFSPGINSPIRTRAPRPSCVNGWRGSPEPASSPPNTRRRSPRRSPPPGSRRRRRASIATGRSRRTPRRDEWVRF